MKKLLVILALAISLISTINAKEPTNIMIGIGAGAGMSTMDIQHSHLLRNPIYSWINNGLGGNTSFGRLGAKIWPAQQNQSLSSWAGAWEFLIGYKHFVNDWVGVRAYGSVAVQHYKPSMFESKTDPIGFIDYTINTDLLINFYENEKFSIGVLGGLGFGGTSFEKDAVGKYMYVYDRTTGMPIEKTAIKQHHFNINGNVGIRATYFQKVRRVNERVCDEYNQEGKRLCRVPVHYIGHSLEVNGRFNLLKYEATSNPDIIKSTVKADTYASRPKYTVKNPYRITVRYIIDF